MPGHSVCAAPDLHRQTPPQIQTVVGSTSYSPLPTCTETASAFHTHAPLHHHRSCHPLTCPPPPPRQPPLTSAAPSKHRCGTRRVLRRPTTTPRELPPAHTNSHCSSNPPSRPQKRLRQPLHVQFAPPRQLPPAQATGPAAPCHLVGS